MIKNILITGATSGIGKASAFAIAKTNAKLILVSKDESKLQKLINDIKANAPDADLDYFVCDLSSQNEIRALADKIKSKYSRLDVLLNNAGLIINDRKTTVDSYQYTFALDHLAYFLLTNLLMDLLKKSAPSRIINTSSEAHRTGHINFDDIMLEKNYSAFKSYGQAKLANILFTYELDRKLKGTGITVNCLHPGSVSTQFGNDLKGFFKVILSLAKPFLISTEKGAVTSVYLATSADVDGVSGKYFKNKKPVKSKAESYNTEIAAKLWNLSEKLTNCKFNV